MNINVIELAGTERPDFNILESRGWIHPPGLKGEPLQRSMVKDIGDVRVQIVISAFRGDPGRDAGLYTRIYLEHKDNDLGGIRRAGEGASFDEGVALVILASIAEELEGALE